MTSFADLALEDAPPATAPARAASSAPAAPPKPKARFADLAAETTPAPAPAAPGLPPMPAVDPKANYWSTDYTDTVKPGSDPYSDALYAQTGSGHYTRPGESYWDSYGRNATYDQKMRDAKLRQPVDPVKILANAASSATGAIAGGYRGLKSLLTGGDTNANSDAVTKTQQTLSYTPSDPESRAMTEMANSGANPLNWPAMAGDWIGGKLGENGMPGAGATVATVGAAVPMLFGMERVRTPVVGAVSDVAAAGKAKLSSLVKPAAPVPPRVEPTLAAPDTPQSITPTSVAPAPQPVTVGTATARPLGVLADPNLTLTPQVPVPGKSAPFPAADVQPPVAGAATPAAPAPVTGINAPRTAANAPTISDPANGIFAESNPDAAGGLPAAEQARRAAVLQAIGLDRVRNSAVTGDAGAASTDFQTSRLDSPAGMEMRNAIAGEKAAITNYADNIVQNTGGSALNDQAAKLARGGTIVAPLDALKGYFDDQTAALYKTADERAQGVPTQLDGFRTALGDDSMLTNSDRVHLQAGVNAYARKLGIMDNDGNVFANAQQAETLRKYLNENWSPQNSGMVGKLKDALDDDVTSAAGEDVYTQARAMRAQRAATLDNPNGIANLMDASGPNSINRKVPVEKIADTVTSMPVAQLGHVVDTLKNAPPEIQPQAQAALAEIKAQYAHNVMDIGSKQAGQWNAKGVRQYLANNSARMAQVFNADEMQRFGALNDAGNILAKDQSYPGAAVQQHNLLRAGVAHGITTGMAGAGGAIGGAPGAALGSIIGSKLAGKFSDASSLRATQKRMTKLSDLVPPQE